MDFSSTERALSSLIRRTPPLSPKIISLATALQTVYPNPLNPEFVTSTIELLRIGTDGGEPLEAAASTAASTAEEEKGSAGTKETLRWEPLAVGFHLTISYLQSATAFYQNGKSDGEDDVYMDGPRVPKTDTTVTSNSTSSTTTANTDTVTVIDEDQLSSFSQIIMTMCQTHLEHNEPRVRSLVAKVVGQHTKLGITLYTQQAAHTILGTTIMNRSIELYKTTNQSLKDHLRSGRDTANKSKSSEGALDDTTGWRAMETNLFCIGSFVHASGGLYFDLVRNGVDTGAGAGTGGNGKFLVDETLLKDIEYCCVTHVNRHVRAAGIALLEQMVHACASSYQKASTETTTTQDNTNTNNNAMELLTSSKSGLRQSIVSILKVTLSDNWSQVRMAASVLCRVFYVTLLDYAEQRQLHTDTDTDTNSSSSNMIDETNEWFTSTYPLLLPRMCLNRFYLAQGVKLYSHDTWRILFERSERLGFGGGGVENVANNAGPICRYYVKMCDADNHVVREAACQAVAELAFKLGRSVQFAEYLAPYVVMLLQALLMCFHDESWPVRDEACLACGTFCLAYPEECKPELPILFSRWTEQLTDQIWSVREDAAVALGDAIEAYGAPMFDQVMEVLRKDLPSARHQPAMTREEFKRRQNDIESHTNSQLYSCGSLAPKLRKGGAGRLGCSDCQITRPKAPWEATDGCIYLIRELCVRLCTNGPGTILEGLALTDDILIPILTELADICRVKHFPQSDDLRTTLWKQLPVIAKALGKQRFKRNYLQLFMELLVKNMENRGSSASQLSVHAAGQCAEELASFVGIGIFRGRFEEDWQRDIFDRTINERKRSARASGPGPTAFSPFGPVGGMVIVGNETKTEVPMAQSFNLSPDVAKNIVPGNTQFETL